MAAESSFGRVAPAIGSDVLTTLGELAEGFFAEVAGGISPTPISLETESEGRRQQLISRTGTHGLVAMTSA